MSDATADAVDEEPFEYPATAEEAKTLLDELYTTMTFRGVPRSGRDDRNVARMISGFEMACHAVYERFGLERPDRVPYADRFKPEEVPEAEVETPVCPQCGSKDLEVRYEIDETVEAARAPVRHLAANEGRWANSPKRYHLYVLNRIEFEDTVDGAEPNIEVSCTACGWHDYVGDHQFEFD